MDVDDDEVNEILFGKKTLSKKMDESSSAIEKALADFDKYESFLKEAAVRRAKVEEADREYNQSIAKLQQQTEHQTKMIEMRKSMREEAATANQFEFCERPLTRLAFYWPDVHNRLWPSVAAPGPSSSSDSSSAFSSSSEQASNSVTLRSRLLLPSSDVVGADSLDILSLLRSDMLCTPDGLEHVNIWLDAFVNNPLLLQSSVTPAAAHVLFFLACGFPYERIGSRAFCVLVAHMLGISFMEASNALAMNQSLSRLVSQARLKSQIASTPATLSSLSSSNAPVVPQTWLPNLRLVASSMACMGLVSDGLLSVLINCSSISSSSSLSSSSSSSANFSAKVLQDSMYELCNSRSAESGPRQHDDSMLPEQRDPTKMCFPGFRFARCMSMMSLLLLMQSASEISSLDVSLQLWGFAHRLLLEPLVFQSASAMPAVTEFIGILLQRFEREANLRFAAEFPEHLRHFVNDQAVSMSSLGDASAALQAVAARTLMEQLEPAVFTPLVNVLLEVTNEDVGSSLRLLRSWPMFLMSADGNRSHNTVFARRLTRLVAAKLLRACQSLPSYDQQTLYPATLSSAIDFLLSHQLRESTVYAASLNEEDDSSSSSSSSSSPASSSNSNPDHPNGLLQLGPSSSARMSTLVKTFNCLHILLGDGSNEKSAVSQASKLAQQLLSKTQVFNAVHRPLRDTLMQFSSFCDALVPPPSM